MDWAARFETFVDKKTTAASTSQIPGYTTVESRTDGQRLSAIGNSWTIDCFDGRFYESWPDDQRLPAVNVVFVQSADGNTGTRNPMELGGGLTDKHLIYEGLSSVHADAIRRDFFPASSRSCRRGDTSHADLTVGLGGSLAIKFYGRVQSIAQPADIVSEDAAAGNRV